MTTTRTCPRCGAPMPERGARSRADNHTEVCAACGTDEAIRALLGEPLPPPAAWPTQIRYDLAALELRSRREFYPPGTRVRLRFTTDTATRLVRGAEGTVRHVDDAGTIHVAWDDGSTLGVVLEAGDRITKITGQP